MKVDVSCAAMVVDSDGDLGGLGAAVALMVSQY